MSNEYVYAGVVPERKTSDGIWTPQRALRDGSIVVASQFEALAEEGRVFVAGMGSVTTPLTFLVTAANRPDAWLRLPANVGVKIRPLRVVVTLEAAAGTVTEIDVRMAQNDIGNGTSSAATVGPLSTRTDSPVGSVVVPRQLATGDTTAETNPVTLYRRQFPFAWATGEGEGYRSVEIARGEGGLGYPVLVSKAAGATLEVFVAATTTQATGFVTFEWAEEPETLLT